MASFRNDGKAVLLLIALGLLSVISNVVLADSRSLTQEQIQDIRAFIRGVLQCRNMAGLTLAVTNTDRVLLEEGFGFADIEKNRPVTADTIIPIGSATKAFTSTLLASLLDSDERYDWDTPVKEILGEEFQLFDEALTEQTTLRDLLAHKTGIPGYYVNLMAGLPKEATRQEIVRRLKHHQPSHEMRTTFMYNNFMYLLAGYVAEVLADNTWEELIRQTFFSPLQMTSSLFVHDVDQEAVTNNMAAPYVYKNNRTVKIDTETLQQADLAAPAGAILSTAKDMSKWLQFHLRKGLAPSGESLLSAELLSETYNWEVVSPPPMSDRDLVRPAFPVSDVLVAYDLGWMTSIYKGYQKVWHSGGLSSYKSQVWFFPDLGFGMFASTNGPPTSGSSWAMILIMYYISDVLIGNTPWLNVSTACSFPQPWQNVASPQEAAFRNDKPPRPLADYSGTYRNPGFDDIIISNNASHGHLELQMSRFLTAILHYNGTSDVFVTELTGLYWHLKDRIPVGFKSSTPGGVINRLDMALYSPYNIAKPTSFCRVSEDSSESDSGCPSDSGQATLPLSQPLLCLLVIVVMKVGVF